MLAEVVSKYNQLTTRQEFIKTIVKEQNQTPVIQNEDVQKAPEKPKKSYMESKTWAKKYDRSGNRHLRFAHEKSTPTFKTKWVTWKGKEFITEDKLKQLVMVVLKRMPHVKATDELASLVVETCVAESNGGYYIKSLGGDYGVLQLRVKTANDLLNWLKYTHKDVYESVVQFKNPKLSMKDNLERNIPFSIALCVCEYWRKAGPNFVDHIATLKERAIMWKSVYNTRKGLGTVKAYITRNKNYSKKHTAKG